MEKFSGFRLVVRVPDGSKKNKFWELLIFFLTTEYIYIHIFINVSTERFFSTFLNTTEKKIKRYLKS